MSFQMKSATLLLLFPLLFTSSCQNQSSDPDPIVLWEAGKGDYTSYRIPSIFVAPDKSILAFCEGRKERSDAGSIALLMRRSTDGGMSWGEESIIWEDEGNTCGNPCPVVDEKTGRIWMFSTWNLGTDRETEIIRKESTDTRRPYLFYSDDSGRTWSEPVDMSASCKDPDWGWYATGPGIGIQLMGSEFKGRIVIPANHSYDDPEGQIKGQFAYGAHVLISDDHGKTWKMSKAIRPGCNESQVVEASDGSLLMNMRSYNEQYSRAISRSIDGGDTWSEIWHDYQLTEPRCQASIIRHAAAGGENLILFSNPATAKQRSHMTIKASRDDGESWYAGWLINAGLSGYSCLVSLRGGDVGILYETGKENYAESLVFQMKKSFPPKGR